MNNKIAVVVGILAVVVAVVLVIRFTLASVSGNSMQPVFSDGDLLLVDRFGQEKTYPKRGDLVLFESPTIGGAEFIARVVGLPGEEIRIEDGVVFVDDEKLLEEYLVPGIKTTNKAERYTHAVLGERQYFLMGDNRLTSVDSRSFGPVMGEKIKARITGIIWKKV